MLGDGIPKIVDYKKIEDNEDFKKMESFSEDFINTNKNLLKKYPWSKDPLHQWSRCWEYTYVYQQIKKIIGKSKVKMLDAGAGWGFFPYFLQLNFPNVEIKCSDYDPKLKQLYEKTNNGSLTVDIADMREMPYEDDTFDVIYCISVLEHTKDYDKIIQEFKRILKPGGTLIITFDISLDGEKEISIPGAKKLAHSLETNFKASKKFNPEEIGESIVTTAYIKENKPEALPWKLTLLTSVYYFLTTGKKAKDFYNLAFFCSTYKKR